MNRILLAAAAFFTAQIAIPAQAEPVHAIAMHGAAALPAGFAAFPYADPAAPKGGRIDYAVTGVFDSVNPFIVQGSAARGLMDLSFGNNVYETLMARSADEAFTLYPLLAKSVETDPERTWVEFTLDEKAAFSDGKPVTPDDVIFTFELLRDKGLPRYGRTIKKIAKMEKVGEHGVRFTFANGKDRELPLILGLMPVLPKHAVNAETFDKSSLTPFPGSGPYLLTDVKPGAALTFKKNPAYWGKDIPSKAGFDNYDDIRVTYYREENAVFEAFKKGDVDVFVENNPGRWGDSYDFPAAAEGKVIKETLNNGLPSGMNAFVFNARRAPFDNPAVRKALGGLFDFEWANANLFSGAYRRTKSFYDNSELSGIGRPASDAEKALLGEHAAKLDPAILDGSWTPPISDGSGRDRAFLKAGLDALAAAGFKLAGGVMADASGKPLAFEILLNGKANEPVANAWKTTLERLGIKVTLNSVDSAQYVQRLQTYDYDVIGFNYSSSLSPGAEQVGRWGSEMAAKPGTFNYAGAADPAIDAMIAALLNAGTREDFVTAVRAYDRVLLNGHWLAPLYFQAEQWVAHWARIKRPEKTPLYGYQLSSWWRQAD